MIRFDAASKRFPDGTVAVSGLSLEAVEGELVVLVGPSRCGKTTTMRMVHRMVQPTSGTVAVDGRDVTTIDPATLRRRIGYSFSRSACSLTGPQRTTSPPSVAAGMEQGGHPGTGRGVACVGWTGWGGDEPLPPRAVPGGQQQHIGVARALAVDPPIMLMDEPFGAVDPIVRGRLQEEFLRLQAELRKTVLFVTHDIDEALRMGDRIAVLAEGGRLQQFDRPEAVLAEPANEFVVDFLGTERGLKRLALIPVSEVKADPGPVVRPGDSAAKAADVAAAAETDWVVIVDAAGRLRGWAWVAELSGRVEDVDPKPFSVQVDASVHLSCATRSPSTGSWFWSRSRSTPC